MGKATGPTNQNLVKLILDLKMLSNKEKVKIWKVIALELERPTRSRRSINISRIDRYSKLNETIIVPGKVLGTGVLTKKVNIAAYQFSDSAKSKLKEHMSIQDIMKKNPKGKDLRILG